MTMPCRTRRVVANGALVLGCVLVWGLAALEPADARRGGGGGGRGARVNVGGGFNGPRTFNPPPSRPANAGQRPPTAGQLPATPPGGGQGTRPVPPVAGGGTRPPVADQPHPSHPIVIPPGSGDRPQRPGDRPPVYYPYPPDYMGPGYYPGYWPPPYEEPYPATPPPAPPPTGGVAGSLPADCRDVVVGNTAYKLCGSTWYAPRFAGNQVVYVVVDPPT